MTGLFISFEGGEGSGKSTQIALLEKAFAEAKLPCIRTREPGGSKGAEDIRKLLVNGDVDAWDPIAETLLFYAARRDHVERLIRPALEAGKTVLTDRFADSTIVYQGVGKQLSEAYIKMLHRLIVGSFKPDLTIILDIDPAIGIARAIERRGTETRFEAMDIDFHHRIRAGFLSIAQREPQRCVVINAEGESNVIHAEIIKTIRSRLNLALHHG